MAKKKKITLPDPYAPTAKQRKAEDTFAEKAGFAASQGQSLPGGEPPLSPQAQETANKQAADKKKAQEAANAKAAAAARNRQQNQESIVQEIQTAMAPQAVEMNNLPGAYNSVMSEINALPGSSGVSSNSPYAAALQGATGKTTQNLTNSELGVEGALQGMPGKVSAMESNLPYADILSTVLQSNKQKLLYGSTAIPYVPKQTGWSAGLKSIYNYLSGTGAGNAPTTGGTAGADQLPSFQKAAQQNATSSGSVPGFGSPY